MSGGGGGSIQAMINSLRSNKNLLGKRPSFAERRKELLTSYSQLKITPKKATKEQLIEVRKKIIYQRKIARRKTIIVLSILLPIITFIIFYIITINKSTAPNISTIKTQANIKKYNFHITDGDKMIQQKKWNNAIFQYTRAQEIFPNELDIQYRVALAYSYKCKYKKESCLTADSLVTRLYSYYPNNFQIIELNQIMETKPNN